MDISEFTEASRPDVIQLWHDCGLTRPWNDPDADIDRAISNPSSTLLCGHVDGGLIGTVMVGYDGHRGWVYYLAAAPSHRGGGIGRRMMQAAEDWLKERGCPKIELMVRETNEATLGFYDALGYEHQPVRVMARWLIEPDSAVADSQSDGASNA